MSTQLTRKERGLCASCNNPPRDGKTLCQNCADKRRERLRAKRAEGYCIKSGCHNRTVGGASRCPECAAKRSKYNKAIASEAKRAGLCPACRKRTPEDGLVHCAKCREDLLARVQGRKYGGNRDAVLNRDDGKCQVCGRRGIAVHHIDGSGGGRSENNELSNLILLCKRCHANIHRIGNKKDRAFGAGLVTTPGVTEEIIDYGEYARREWREIRLKALKRGGEACSICKAKDKLLVHHKDDRGPGRATPANNADDNLCVLCRSCHNAVTNLRNNGDRKLASKLIYALGAGTTGQRIEQ